MELLCSCEHKHVVRHDSVAATFRGICSPFFSRSLLDYCYGFSSLLADKFLSRFSQLPAGFASFLFQILVKYYDLHIIFFNVYPLSEFQAKWISSSSLTYYLIVIQGLSLLTLSALLPSISTNNFVSCSLNQFQVILFFFSLYPGGLGGWA